MYIIDCGEVFVRKKKKRRFYRDSNSDLGIQSPRC